MTRVLILARSELTAAAVEAIWIARGRGVERNSAVQVDAAAPIRPERFIVDTSKLPVQGTLDTYQDLVDKIQSTGTFAQSQFTHTRLTILVDHVDIHRLRIGIGSTWESLLAMLIMTFPEVHWIFLNTVTSNAEQFPWDLESHSILGEGCQHRSYLLDPTGLRSSIFERTSDLMRDCPRMLVRRQRALSVDDEPDFAALHAYTAYRFGYRADTASSWHSMKRCMSHGDGYYEISFEDMRLQFEDLPVGLDISSLKARDENILASHNVKIPQFKHGRYLITSGHSKSEGATVCDNQAYLAFHKDSAMSAEKRWQNAQVIPKPAGGMFDLWNVVKPITGFFKYGAYWNRRLNANYEKGYHWPPCGKVEDASSRISKGHGSPAKLANVAQTLLARATSVFNSAARPSDYLSAAVLSGIAAEVLCGRNPTSYLAALSLRHRAEASAEVAFIGAGFHLDVRSRCKELERETEELSQWFSNGSRAKFSSRAHILSQLATIYRDAGLVEEESVCLVDLRYSNRQLELCNDKVYNKIFVHGPMLYAEFLLANFTRFVILCGLYFAVLWIAYYYGSRNHYESLNGAIGTYLGGNGWSSSAKPENWTNAISGLIGALFGAFHVGVFISYIYSLIARK